MSEIDTGPRDGRDPGGRNAPDSLSADAPSVTLPENQTAIPHRQDSTPHNPANHQWNQDLEHLLLSDNFYSSHEQPAQKEPSPPAESLRRTSFMKVSPSMKALETILKGSGAGSVAAEDKIVEEDEDEDEDENQANAVAGASLLSPMSTVTSPLRGLSTLPRHNRESTYSVQSFETAKSFNSPHKSTRSPLGSIDSLPSDQSTPVMEDATFHKIKTPLLVQNGMSFPAHHSTTPALDSSTPQHTQVPSASSDTSLATTASNGVSQKYFKSIVPPSQRKEKPVLKNLDNGPKSDKLLKQVLIQKDVSPTKQPSPLSQEFSRDSESTDSSALPEHSLAHGSLENLHSHEEDAPSKSEVSPERSEVSKGIISDVSSDRSIDDSIQQSLPEGLPQSAPSVASTRAAKLVVPQNSVFTAPANTGSAFPHKMSTSASSPSFPLTSSRFPSTQAQSEGQPPPAKKLAASPHTRSKSSFNLSFQSKDTPNTRQKRSSTFSDLSAGFISNSKKPSAEPVEKQDKKKFSFKSLFKSKSKSHSLNQDVTQKMSSKSFSTSNLQSLDKKPVSAKNEQYSKNKNISSNSNSQNSSSSLLNVFKRNRSSDNLSSRGGSTSTTKNEMLSRQTTNTSISRASVKSAHSLAPTPIVAARAPQTTSIAEMERNNMNNKSARAFKSNTAINFIREVNDDDYDPSTVKQKQKTEENNGKNDDQSSEDDEFYHEYDETNLEENPPQKLSNARYDEEIHLISFAKEDIETQFGSPFQVKYEMESPSQSPTRAKNKPTISISNLSTPGSYDKEEQMLGDSLFPKSLSAQEVESIVSLERSRSMKSIKSNKRNSFVNYNGSDENVIQYHGSPPGTTTVGTGMKRSNSILKNSTSRRNLSSELYPSIDGRSKSIKRREKSGPGESASESINDSAIESIVESPIENLHVIETAQQELTPTSPAIIISDSNAKRATENYDLFDNTNDTTMVENESTQIIHVPLNSNPNNHDFIDFSEFSDFIDISNFPNSPKSPALGRFPPKNVPSLVVSIPPTPQLFDSPVIREKGQLESVSQTSVSEEQVTPLTGENKGQANGSQKQEETEKEAENGSEKVPEKTENKYSAFESPISPQENIENIIGSSPILASAYRTSTDRSPKALSPELGRTGSLDGAGTTNYNNRPISMSFRGLKGPSFGGLSKIPDGLQQSDSHQSFNLSFTEDSDAGAGGGYGTDDDDEEDEEFSYRDSVESKENKAPTSTQVAHKVSPKAKLGNKIVNPSFPPPPSFKPEQADLGQHRRSASDAGSVGSTSSSKSFSSMISRKWKKPSKNSPETPQKTKISSTVLQQHLPGYKNSLPLKFSQSQQSSMNSSSQTASPTGVRFSSRIILYDTYNGEEYDRHPDTATCNQLTPLLAQQIKNELNSFKSEMSIHASSQCYTHYF